MAYPILAPNSTWYKSSENRSTITEINIVNSYNGTADETWNADIDNSGSIKCYRTGTVLTIAGDGSGGIYLNPDSTFIFSDINRADYFILLTVINGSELLFTYTDTNLDLAFTDCENLLEAPHIPQGIISMRATFQKCIKMTNANSTNWDVSKVTNMRYLFSKCHALTTVDTNNWNTSNVTNMYGMFQQCISLKTVNAGVFDMSNVTDTAIMFASTGDTGAMTITDIGDTSGWDLSKVKITNGMFQNCRSLNNLDVSQWNLSSCTDMGYMFNYCNSLTSLDVSKWDVSNVTTMKYMFNHCISLTYLDVSRWDMGKVETTYCMFEECIKLNNLDVSKWNLSSCTDMGWMFWGCSSLTSLDVSLWDVSNVDSLHHFAAHCDNLVISGLENWDVSKCRTFNAMFHSIRNTSYDLSKWDVSNCLLFAQMFESNTQLIEIKGLENWNTSKAITFEEMFNNCPFLRELNLSSFDTRQVAEEHYDEWRDKTYPGSMLNMFSGTFRLQQVTLGENFSFNGDGTCQPTRLLTPNSTYLHGADGYWYDSNGNKFRPELIPSLTSATYYAVKNSAVVIDEKEYSNLTINRVKDQNTYKNLQLLDNIREDEIYLIDENISSVLYSPQNLNNSQQLQVRKNIGAGTGEAFISKVSGNIIEIINSDNTSLVDLHIFGASTQESTPSVETPAEIISVGNNGKLQIFSSTKNLYYDPKYSYGGSASGYGDNITAIEGTANGVIVTGTAGNTPGTAAYSNGWYHTRRILSSQAPEQGLTLKKGMKITISADVTPISLYESVANFAIYLTGYDKDQNNYNQTNITKSYALTEGITTKMYETYILDQDLTFVCPMFTLNSSTLKIENVQIEIGATATEYAKHNKNKIELNLIKELAGIPVSSNGTYIDENKQFWIADEIDFRKGVFIQRINKIENYAFEEIGDIWISSTGSLTEGATVLYVLPEAIETSLSTTDIEAFNNMYTYNPITIIYSFNASYLDIIYKPFSIEGQYFFDIINNLKNSITIKSWTKTVQ